ncbi:hypothetical protein H2203_003119 [Taxawa tesnikishii (nom. ined.)]|nr:hypothetical protein H2203_003119 [Dothideales sp. JES 119]
MPIIRNPFRKQDENARPNVQVNGSEKDHSAKPIDIKEPTEYKLSEINDSGVFMPPSPPERKAFWSTKSSSSTNSSNHRSVLNENEPFNISRESFDSYRRSFDISARSPVVFPESRPRQSLDSRAILAPRSSATFARPQPPTAEEGFEDVGLNDDPKPKKRGFLSRLTDSDGPATGTDSRPTSSHHGFHFTGRKRGQSGQGAELGNMKRPDSRQGNLKETRTPGDE